MACSQLRHLSLDTVLIICSFKTFQLRLEIPVNLSDSKEIFRVHRTVNIFSLLTYLHPFKQTINIRQLSAVHSTEL